MYNFNYHRPASVAEAASLLGSHGDAKLMAGGQTFIPTLKQRLAQPSDLIDLGGIAELKGIKEEAGGVTIGAMTRHADVASSEVVRRVIPSLAGLVEEVGDAQVRNMGTIGGSISNNDPAADYPGALLALGATVRTNKREIPADDFFIGMFETALAPDEIVTAVHFPKPEKGAYVKFPNPASRYSMVGVYVARTGG
ncbi:MAG TPA: xanthine dehydrogenase family protein subunit M, partial [Geminicoccaceae bacterium]|nr:xanthine dehydrogenase family protein subunit M [Geminicoccaceae bacterium]